MIYFITARTVGLVKIGHARRPQERFTSIKTHSPVPLSLERVCDGSRAEEEQLHVRFAADRSHGEWFRITPELDLFMQSLPTHQWRHRGWQHAAKRALLTPATEKAA